MLSQRSIAYGGVPRPQKKRSFCRRVTMVIHSTSECVEQVGANSLVSLGRRRGSGGVASCSEFNFNHYAPPDSSARQSGRTFSWPQHRELAPRARELRTSRRVSCLPQRVRSIAFHFATGGRQLGCFFDSDGVCWQRSVGRSPHEGSHAGCPDGRVNDDRTPFGGWPDGAVEAREAAHRFVQSLYTRIRGY